MTLKIIFKKDWLCEMMKPNKKEIPLAFRI